MNPGKTVAVVLSVLAASAGRALGSQEEFFKGLGGGLGGESAGDPTKALAIAGMVVGGLIVILCLARLRKTRASRPVHHPGKLAREITKKAGLKPAQLKKLKPLAEQAEVSSPLVLLLCPSVMAEAMRKGRKV